MGEDRPPTAGEDYPRTFEEFETFFPNERACREHLFRVRWPNGFVCPGCRATSGAWLTARGYLHCRACERETSLTAGTVFERTRTSLRTWYLAMWFVASQKHGASALGLQRVLGLGSYQTAWTWLHKLRRAMVRPGRDGLRGYVEVDETYVGGEEEGVHGRQTLTKAIVAIAVEVKDPKGFGRVRMRRIADVSARSLTPFVCHAVERGATVHTDGWGGYNVSLNHGAFITSPDHALLRPTIVFSSWRTYFLERSVLWSPPQVHGRCSTDENRKRPSSSSERGW